MATCASVLMAVAGVLVAVDGARVKVKARTLGLEKFHDEASSIRDGLDKFRDEASSIRDECGQLPEFAGRHAGTAKMLAKRESASDGDDKEKMERMVARLTAPHPISGKALMNKEDAEALGVQILQFIKVEKCLAEMAEAGCPRATVSGPPPLGVGNLSKSIRVLALQWAVPSVTPLPELEANLDSNISAAVASNGTIDIVVLPEHFLIPVAGNRNSCAKVEPVCIKHDLEDKGLSLLGSPHLDVIAKLARKHEVYVLAGTVLEKSFNKYSERVYVTSVLIGPKGELVGSYRKRKFGGSGVPVGDFFAIKGKRQENGVFDTSLGRIGVLVCSDTDVIGGVLVADTLKYQPALLLVPTWIARGFPDDGRDDAMEFQRARLGPVLKEAQATMIRVDAADTGLKRGEKGPVPGMGSSQMIGSVDSYVTSPNGLPNAMVWEVPAFKVKH